ncbi:MAG: glucose-1-phosphate cytidylyltransferase, partial [Cyclonatronaceae bacterium]
MKYYAHYGHTDFILCLGYKGDYIKRYFVEYNEYISNDFVLGKGHKDIKLLNSDLDDWTITFVDTGMTSNIGQRLMKVKPHLEGEEIFLANYSDGLTDLPLNKMINRFHETDKVASFMAYRSTQSFHVVELGDEGAVNSISPISKSGLWINTGYFIFKQQIFDYMKPGEELVVEPFQRLIEDNQLNAYPFDGFWTSMDTFKDKQLIDSLYSSGQTHWEVWKNGK